MTLTLCNYCEHGNPADAKYCNSCGATLTLAPCRRCGAVNEVTSATCYQCRGNLQESGKDLLVPALLAAAIPRPSLRQPALAIVGTVVVAIIVFIGYFAYRHLTLDSLSPSAAVNTEAKGRSGALQPVPSQGPAATPAAPVAAAPASAGLSAVTTPAAATPQRIEGRASRQPAEPPAAAAIAPPAALLRPGNVGKAGELAPPRLGPCTEKVAALGLCTLAPVARQTAQAAAAVPAAVARPQSNNGEKPCTEAIAALGLCPPKSK